jgi:hypothetical protein
MSGAAFLDALTQARKELEGAIMQRDEINLEILRLQQLVKALSYQTHKENDDQTPDTLSDRIGFTEAVLTVLRTATSSMTARNVRDRLLELGFELGRYSNPLGFVHSVLGRLEAQGKIRQSAPGEYTFNTFFWRALFHAKPNGPTPDGTGTYVPGPALSDSSTNVPSLGWLNSDHTKVTPPPRSHDTKLTPPPRPDDILKKK